MDQRTRWYQGAREPIAFVFCISELEQVFPLYTPPLLPMLTILATNLSPVVDQTGERCIYIYIYIHRRGPM